MLAHNHAKTEEAVSNPAKFKLDLMEYVRKHMQVAWANGSGNVVNLYKVSIDPTRLSDPKAYDFVVSFQADPMDGSAGYDAYLAVVNFATDFLKEAGLDVKSGDYIIRVRCFLPGSKIGLPDKVAYLGNGHWRPGQSDYAYNVNWWERTDGE